MHVMKYKVYLVEIIRSKLLGKLLGQRVVSLESSLPSRVFETGNV
jgi:hypothetical protein